MLPLLLFLTALTSVKAEFWLIIIFDENEDGDITGINPWTYLIWAVLVLFCIIGRVVEQQKKDAQGSRANNRTVPPPTELTNVVVNPEAGSRVSILKQDGATVHSGL
jgi:hypothetical protein